MCTESIPPAVVAVMAQYLSTISSKLRAIEDALRSMRSMPTIRAESARFARAYTHSRILHGAKQIVHDLYHLVDDWFFVRVRGRIGVGGVWTMSLSRSARRVCVRTCFLACVHAHDARHSTCA